jgi:hypothetical protein
MYDARFLYYRGCDSDRTYVTERPTLLFAVRVITAVIGLLTTVIGHVPYYVICHIMSYFDYFNQQQPATRSTSDHFPVVEASGSAIHKVHLPPQAAGLPVPKSKHRPTYGNIAVGFPADGHQSPRQQLVRGVTPSHTSDLQRVCRSCSTCRRRAVESHGRGH